MEELLAELGSTFLRGYLGIAQAPALTMLPSSTAGFGCLKADKKGIFTAASQAWLAAKLLADVQAGELDNKPYEIAA